MKNLFFILEKGLVVEEPDFEKAMLWNADHSEDMRIAYDETDLYVVSTVFLGVNLTPGRPEPPQVFETMVFWSDAMMQHARMRGVEIDLVVGQRRSSTLKEAQSSHEEVLAGMPKYLENVRHETKLLLSTL